MVIGSAIFGLVKGLISPATDLLKGWQARKKVKLESDLAITAAKTQSIVTRLKTQQEGDIAWENTSIANAGWKDEFWTLVIAVPAVICFFGETMAAHVTAGFVALSACPEWYQWALMVSVASAFGYKKIADFMALKKGS